MSDHDEDAEPGHERWLVSYADFITLMFAFFAVLYATSQHDVEKAKDFQESIKKFLMKGAGGVAAGGPAQIEQTQKGDSAIEQALPTYKQTKTEAATKLDEAEEFLEAKLTAEERARYVIALDADDWGVRLTLKNEAVFAEGSDRFRPEALPFLNKVGEWLKASSRKVFIEGHVGAGETGSFRNAWDFASARAVNLLRYLEKKHGLEARRLAAASLADSRPLFGNGHAVQNSRLEVVLLNGDLDL